MAGLCESGNEPLGSLKATSWHWLKMDIPILAPAACEVRSVIKFLNAQYIALIEIYRQLCQVYGSNVMSKRMIATLLEKERFTKGSLVKVTCCYKRVVASGSFWVFTMETVHTRSCARVCNSAKGTSKEIQNDLLQCMLDVCRDEIKTEIQQADFLSVMADEISDVSSQYQMVIVFRYLLSNGKPVERFWAFKNSCGHDAQALATRVKDALEEVVSDKTKVISQSYDGANVMSGAHSGVQEIVK
ncbi:hypothetical protein ANN_24923 [Periplaneta americana]|uniref:DUF4371 domain-containing protein n=1 Tax=Periplaneta americana TaxID=6978 RepID=A0ABQ8RZY2_PERAM|nr:hypothetical protein ANN_24923 [Periplaneta americana]